MILDSNRTSFPAFFTLNSKLHLNFYLLSFLELPPGFAVLSPLCGLEMALVRQTTSKLSVCSLLLASFPL